MQTDVNRKIVRVVQPTLCEASSQAPEAHVQQSGESVRRCLRQEGQQHLKSFCRPDGRSPAEEPLREAFPQKRAALNLRPRPPSVPSAVMGQESYSGHARRCSLLHGARLRLRRLFQLTYQCCSERMLRMRVERQKFGRATDEVVSSCRWWGGLFGPLSKSLVGAQVATVNECGLMAYGTPCVASFGLLLVMMWIGVPRGEHWHRTRRDRHAAPLVPPWFEVGPGFRLAWKELWNILKTRPAQGLSKMKLLTAEAVTRSSHHAVSPPMVRSFLRRTTNCNVQVVSTGFRRRS